MMECEKCLNEQRIMALEEDKKRNSEQHKEFYGQLKDIEVDGGRKEERENARDRTISSVLQMQMELKAAFEKMQEKEKEKPIKRMDRITDRLIDKAVDFVIVAIIGYIGYVAIMFLK